MTGHENALSECLVASVPPYRAPHGISSVTHFKFTAALDSGRRVDFTPRRAQPLTLTDLRATAGEANPSFKISWSATQVLIDGDPQESNGVFNAAVTFQEAPRPYALVPGGWLPLPLVIPARFLVDRNVVADLRRIRNNPIRPNLQHFEWWMRLMGNGAALFNPLPYAWEGGYRRSPEYAEFVEAFEEGVTEIRAALPNAALVTYGPAEFRAAFAIRSAYEENARREAAFLEAVCPFLVDRIKQGDEAKVEKMIFEHSTRCSVARSSFACIAALSCLYEDPHGAGYSIGRGLLKPTVGYGTEAAYNAVADLGHMSLAIIGGACFGNDAFALATSDIALASFWCALRPTGTRNDDSDFEFTFDVTPQIFPRLSQPAVDRLGTLIGESNVDESS